MGLLSSDLSVPFSRDVFKLDKVTQYLPYTLQTPGDLKAEGQLGVPI